MHATDIVAYTYQAEILCPHCIVVALDIEACVSQWHMSTEEALTGQADLQGIDRFDERSFDSDDFPKVVFSVQMMESEPCGMCGEELP